MRVNRISAQEVLDSCGNPTLEGARAGSDRKFGILETASDTRTALNEMSTPGGMASWTQLEDSRDADDLRS